MTKDTEYLILTLRALARDNDLILLTPSRIAGIADRLEELQKALEQKTAESMAIAVHYNSNETLATLAKNGATIEPLYPKPKRVTDDLSTDGEYLMFWPKYGWCRALRDRIIISDRWFWRIKAINGGAPIDRIEYRWFLSNPPTHYIELPPAPTEGAKP
jgi:hypothetical protein